jgi:hypothetical protein
VSGVGHRVLNQALSPIVSLPQRCNVERGSVAPMRIRATIFLGFNINSATIFNYPPTLSIRVRDSLTSDGSGSASAMSVQLGVRSGVEQEIAIGGGATVVASTSGGPQVVGHRRTRILIRL